MRAEPHRSGARLMAVATLALSALLQPAGAAHQATGDDGLRLGVFPYMAARQTIELYGPVAADMARTLGRRVRLESTSTMADYARALASQRYDIALVQPFDYLEAVERFGYLPLAQLSEPLVARFYVRDSSPHQSLADLRGTTIALPPATTAIARVAFRTLHEQGLEPGRDLQLRYLGSHDDCLQQLWIGAVSACAAGPAPAQVFARRMNAQLRPVHAAAPIPQVAILVHPRLPAAQRARLQARLIDWRDSDQGRALLRGLGMPGFVAPRPADYEVMRQFDAPLRSRRPVGGQLWLGVFPYFVARDLVRDFAPALPALGRAAGRSLVFRSSSSFDGFVDALRREDFDLAVIQPFDFALARQHGYVPLAAMNRPVHGEFFVRDASAVHGLGDLRGQRVTMPPYESALSRLGRQALLKAGLNLDTDLRIDYQRGHDACLQQVHTGHAEACLTSPFTLQALPATWSAGLRPVGRTLQIPGIVWMVHERVPAALRERWRAEVLAWKDHADGRSILDAIGLGELGAVDVAAYERLPQFGAPR